MSTDKTKTSDLIVLHLQTATPNNLDLISDEYDAFGVVYQTAINDVSALEQQLQYRIATAIWTGMQPLDLDELIDQWRNRFQNLWITF